MKSGIERRVDDLGRIVLPKELRQQAGISYGDLCDVSIGENGTIVISKQTTLKDISGEIKRIKDAVLDDETIDYEITEEIFRCLNKIENFINLVKE